MNSKKGSSLIIVFIVCLIIAMIISTSLIVTSNYNISLFSRSDKLQEDICEGCEFDFSKFTTTTCPDCYIEYDEVLE